MSRRSLHRLELRKSLSQVRIHDLFLYIVLRTGAKCSEMQMASHSNFTEIDVVHGPARRKASQTELIMSLMHCLCVIKGAHRCHTFRTCRTSRMTNKSQQCFRQHFACISRRAAPMRTLINLGWTCNIQIQFNM